MIRPYVEYKNKMLGKRIDTDNYPRYGRYQCVDLIKDYCNTVLGMKLTKTGNANEIWSNKYGIFWKQRDHAIWTKNLMQWDIIVRGTDTGYHVAIFDRYVNGKVYVLEQNGSGKNSGSWTWDNAIRVHGYSPSFWTGVRRSTKIIDNYADEVSYIQNKIAEQWEDKITIDYFKSIRIK